MNPDTMARDGESVQSESSVTANPGGPEPDRRSFKDRVQEFERQIITDALAETGGRVTRAAKNLGLTHQGLCYIINHRHPELLTHRKPIQIRRKSIIPKDKLHRQSK
jgi:transcriptional regulator with PAS, ATPase and Fis domain